MVKSEFNFVAFCRSLMQERTEVEFTQLEQSHKVSVQLNNIHLHNIVCHHSTVCVQQERVALSLADLITYSSMLTANMLIREAYNGYTKATASQLLEFSKRYSYHDADVVRTCKNNPYQCGI